MRVNSADFMLAWTESLKFARGPEVHLDLNGLLTGQGRVWTGL